MLTQRVKGGQDMTYQKFLELSDKRKVTACHAKDYKELVFLACKEQAKFNGLLDLQQAMYRLHKQAIAKPKAKKAVKPVYHTVTSNMLVRAMYDIHIPWDEKLV